MSSLFLVIGFIITMVVERQLKRYIKQTYPDEWERMSKERMGVASSLTRPIMLDESIKTGFLSTQNDPKLSNLVLRQKMSLVLFAVFVVVGALVD